MKSKSARVVIPGRVPVLLRLDEKLAEWYRVRGALQGRSRTILMGNCLGQLRLLVERMEQWGKDGIDPRYVAGAVGTELLTALLELGFGSEVVRDALEHVHAENRRVVEQAGGKAGSGHD